MNNLFSKDQQEALISAIDNEQYHLDDIAPNAKLGRMSIRIDSPLVDSDEYNKVIMESSEFLRSTGLTMRGMNAVEYNSKYGEPNLPPHWDSDQTDIIVNYQLQSNTTWGVGVDEQVFPLVDNTAIVFNPNESIHWRPIKKFEPGEYVRMVFFRFWNKSNPTDNSHLDFNQDNPVFDKIRDIRNSL